MTGRLTWERITLQLRTPFRVSYGASDTRTAYWIRLAEDEGWGEGTIPAYYGIPETAMTELWDAAARRTDPLPDDLDGIEGWVGTDGPAPARAALDLALHDRLGRAAGLPLHTLVGAPAPVSLATSFTISLGSPEEMAEMARQASAYPILKIKLGTDDDASRLGAVRAARPDALLRVDANAGWSPEEAVRQIAAMEPFDLEMVEQPVPKHDIEGMGFVQRHTPLPVVADESVQTLADVEALAAAGVHGINVKLMKVGGVGPALRILRRAQVLGLRVMLGCMIETAIGVTAMAHLSGFAEWVDLDAPVLVSNDPFDGLSYDSRARICLPERPGIGVVRKPEAAA